MFLKNWEKIWMSRKIEFLKLRKMENRQKWNNLNGKFGT